LVKNNVVDTFCNIKDDGGGIYTYSFDGNLDNLTLSGRVISQNVVMNGIGASLGTTNPSSSANGIYQDGSVNNISVIDNTVYNIGRSGFHNNGNINLFITGNTVFNSRIGYDIARFEKTFSGNTISGNTFFVSPLSGNTFSGDADKNILFFYDDNNIDSPLPLQSLQSRLSSFGVIDTNKYYLGNDYNVRYTYAKTNGIDIFPLNIGYEQLRVFSGFDINSSVYPMIKPYVIKGLGVNMYANSGFTNITGVGYYSEGSNSSISLDTSGVISGSNSLRVNVTSAVPMDNRNFTLVYASIGNLVLGNNYLLRFKIKSSGSYGVVASNLRLTNSPYTDITSKQYATFGTSIRNMEFLFSGVSTSSVASWEIDVSQYSGTVWIDDVQVFSVDADMLLLSDYSKFLCNDTDLSKTYNLGGSYTGMTDNIVYTGVTLAPYTSKILIK
jgi:hypothetical protein